MTREQTEDCIATLLRLRAIGVKEIEGELYGVSRVEFFPSANGQLPGAGSMEIPATKEAPCSCGHSIIEEHEQGLCIEGCDPAQCGKDSKT